jgi:putative ATP-binding cassette transporter
MTDAINAESPHNPLALEEETRGLINQFRDFLNALWLSEGRRTLTMLTITTVAVICVTVVVQVGLNAWNKPFYDAVAARNLSAFFYQLLVFVLIAGSLLILNVAQTWLREMIKLKSREWLTRDLVAQWLKPGRACGLPMPARLASTQTNASMRIPGV